MRTGLFSAEIRKKAITIKVETLNTILFIYMVLGLIIEL